MAYIGKEPTVGNFQVCDAISVVNGQAAYTMQVSSTNVVPESANHMLVSLNGILQKPNSSFTVSGSTITFASNLATGDVIDFIMLLGNVLDIGTPSDSTVTNAKTNFTTTSSAAGLQIKGDGTTAGAIQLNCEQNSHGILLQSPPHSANQSYTLKFPSGNVTAGKFLKVDSVSGSGTTGIGTMSFADAGGTHTKIATADYSSAVSNFTISDCFSSSYSIYKIYLFDLFMASNNSELRIHFLDSGGSDVGNFQYSATESYIATSGSTSGHQPRAQDATDYIRVSGDDLDSISNEPSALEMTVFQPYEAKHTLVSTRYYLRADNNYYYNVIGFAASRSTTSMRSLKFTNSSAINFSGYKTVVYGVQR